MTRWWATHHVHTHIHNGNTWQAQGPLSHAHAHAHAQVVEAGGFTKADLSVNGATMAGCSAKGQLLVWNVAAELRKVPDGSMLYRWLASMPLSKARDIYRRLLEVFPLLMNTQDSRGWTILMHAASDANPDITKLITSHARAKSGVLGLMASPLAALPGISLEVGEDSGYWGNSMGGVGGMHKSSSTGVPPRGVEVHAVHAWGGLFHRRSLKERAGVVKGSEGGDPENAGTGLQMGSGAWVGGKGAGACSC